MSAKLNMGRVCQAFEDAWIAGLKPQISDYVDDFDSDFRPELLSKLILLDVAYRLKLRTPPSAEDYKVFGPNAVEFADIALNREQPTFFSDSDQPELAETIVPAVGCGSNVIESDDEPETPPQTIAGRGRHTLPRQFGDYELIEEIARGGMGVVYKARQQKLNRTVALKMILAGHLAGTEELQRFQIEAQAAANLDHPWIVPVYEIGEHNGQAYFSMGYVEGVSLADHVRDAPLDPRFAAGLIQKIAEAIAFAHANGIIHRDLKPANILLDSRGEPRVTDFGLARRIEHDSGITRTGDIMGTPSFMSPEQATGRTDEVGPLSDVYSVGAILYRLITGRPPFQASNVLDTLKQVAEVEPVSPRSLNPEIDDDLATICLRCLEKEPARRHPDAQFLSDECSRYLQGKPILSRQPSRVERLQKWCLRKRAEAALFGMILIVVILSSVLIAVFGIPSIENRFGAGLVQNSLCLLCLLGPTTSLGRIFGPGGVRTLELKIIRGAKNCVYSIAAAASAFIGFAFVSSALLMWSWGSRIAGDSDSEHALGMLVLVGISVGTWVQSEYKLKPGPKRLWGIFGFAVLTLTFSFNVEFLELLQVPAIGLFLVFCIIIGASNTYWFYRQLYIPAHGYATVVKQIWGWTPWPFSLVQGRFRVRNVMLFNLFLPFAFIVGTLQLGYSALSILLLVPIWIVEQLRQILLPDSPMTSEFLGYLISLFALATLFTFAVS